MVLPIPHIVLCRNHCFQAAADLLLLEPMLPLANVLLHYKTSTCKFASTNPILHLLIIAFHDMP